MGNRTEEDYNFVFKGELGSIKKETAEPESARPVLLFLFFLISHLDP